MDNTTMGQALGAGAQRIIGEGQARIKVKRAGVLQFVIFRIKRIKAGSEQFVELFSDRMIDRDEIIRVANETGLPVEAQNGRAFPEGKGAKDFLGL